MRVDSLYEKGTGELNEDFLLVDGNLFGVLDGATSLSSDKYTEGYTGGYLASHMAGEIFKKNNASLRELAAMANRAIREAMVENGADMSRKAGLWSASASVVRVGDDSFEWLRIGDSPILVLREDGDHELLAPTPDHDLETLTMWKAIAAETDEPIHVALRDQIALVRSGMNVIYGVLSGEEEALSFLNTGIRSLRGVEALLLFTDGLTIPRRDPADKGDYNALVELYRRGGLVHVRDYIRRLEESDPGCRVYPRFKSHDDIAAISVAF